MSGRRLMNLESTAKLVMIIPTDGGVIVPPCLPLPDSDSVSANLTRIQEPAAPETRFPRARG